MLWVLIPWWAFTDKSTPPRKGGAPRIISLIRVPRMTLAPCRHSFISSMPIVAATMRQDDEVVQTETQNKVMILDPLIVVQNLKILWGVVFIICL